MNVECQASQSFTISQVCSNSCPLSQWCQATISSSVAPSPPALNLAQHQGHFQRVSFFSAGGQRIRASASAPVLSKHIQSLSPLGLTGLISLLSKGLKRLLQHQHSKALILWPQPSLWSNPLIHTWLLEKNIALITWTFVSKVIPMLFNILSRFNTLPSQTTTLPVAFRVM